MRKIIEQNYNKLNHGPIHNVLSASRGDPSHFDHIAWLGVQVLGHGVCLEDEGELSDAPELVIRHDLVDFHSVLDELMFWDQTMCRLVKLEFLHVKDLVWRIQFLDLVHVARVLDNKDDEIDLVQRERIHVFLGVGPLELLRQVVHDYNLVIVSRHRKDGPRVHNGLNLLDGQVVQVVSVYTSVSQHLGNNSQALAYLVRIVHLVIVVDITTLNHFF